MIHAKPELQLFADFAIARGDMKACETMG